MRTTLTINDQLLNKAKRLSIERQCSLGAVIEDALQLALATKRDATTKKSFQPFKTFKAGGLQAGVDFSSNVSVLERMEG